MVNVNGDWVDELALTFPETVEEETPSTFNESDRLAAETGAGVGVGVGVGFATPEPLRATKIDIPEGAACGPPDGSGVG